MKFWENMTLMNYNFTHLTLGNPKKAFLIILLCTSDDLHYIRIKRTIIVTVNRPTTSEKYHCTILWNAEFVHLIEGVWFSSKFWLLWKRAGCDVWQLEFKSSNVTASVQSDHLLHLPVLFCFTLSTTLCWNSAHVMSQKAAAPGPYHGLVLDTRALASCHRYGNLPDLDQDCSLATC